MTDTSAKSAFRFSNLSRSRLHGVHPDLVRVFERALELTPVDFLVVEGLRTQSKQDQLVASGASRTKNSRHLNGGAVDIAPMVGRQVRWDWPLFPVLADAVRKAAIELGVVVTWGGVWDKPLNEIAGDLDDEAHAYGSRYRAKNPGKKPLVDGPHFQIELPKKK